MDNDERAEIASRDVRHTHDKLSVCFAVRDELARGTDKQRSRAFEALADEAYEEAMDILDRSPSILVPVRPCPVVCELTLRHEVQDVQDLCQWVLQAVLQGFEHAGLIEDFDGFLDLNRKIDVAPQMGDKNEVRCELVVERVYDKARARVSRKRKQLRESPGLNTSAHGGGQSTKKVSEQRFTCKACGKVWHISTREILAETGKALMCCGGCVPAGAMMKEAGRCPDCGSRNVKQERVEYEVERASVEPSLQAFGAAERIILSVLRAYKILASPMLARYVRCRFYPSCSSYAMIAVEKHGWLRGSAKAIQRLARCHPRNHATCVDLP